MIRSIALLALTALLFGGVEASASGRSKNAKAMLEQRREALFTAIDTDGDGYLSFEEYRKYKKGSGTTAATLHKEFKKLDRDGDGQLTKDEFFGTVKEQKKNAPKKK